MRQGSLAAAVGLAAALAVLAPMAAQAHTEDDHETVDVFVVERSDVEPPLAFTPRDATAPLGALVRWRNTADAFVTVTSTADLEDKRPDGRFDAALAGFGDEFTHEYTEPGTYHYYSQPSDQRDHLWGNVTVVDTGPTHATTPGPGPLAGLAGAAVSWALIRPRVRKP